MNKKLIISSLFSVSRKFCWFTGISLTTHYIINNIIKYLRRSSNTILTKNEIENNGNKIFLIYTVIDLFLIFKIIKMNI